MNLRKDSCFVLEVVEGYEPFCIKCIRKEGRSSLSRGEGGLGNDPSHSTWRNDRTKGFSEYTVGIDIAMASQ